MKIYLSMSSADLDAVRAVMARIEATGHSIVYDWTESFDPSISRERWSELGQKDIQAAADADLMVLYGEPTSGCYVELGAARLAGTPVVWFSDASNPVHFFLHWDKALLFPEDDMETVLAFAGGLVERLNDSEKGQDDPETKYIVCDPNCQRADEYRAVCPLYDHPECLKGNGVLDAGDGCLVPHPHGYVCLPKGGHDDPLYTDHRFHGEGHRANVCLKL